MALRLDPARGAAADSSVCAVRSREAFAQWDVLSRELASLAREAMLGEGSPEALHARLDDLRAQIEECECRFVLLERPELRSESTWAGPTSDDALLTILPCSNAPESAAWAVTLATMYARWATRRGFTQALYTAYCTPYEAEEAPSDGRGLPCAVLALRGRDVCGLASTERGFHRQRLESSEVWVEARVESDEYRLWGCPSLEDCERSAVRGFDPLPPGRLNMRSTAVRLRGPVFQLEARSEGARSMRTDMRLALRALGARSLEERRRIGDRDHNAAPDRVRSYATGALGFAHDHRLGRVVSVGPVLDGDLDAFMRAMLRRPLGRFVGE